MLKIVSKTGGGARGPALAGAELACDEAGRWHPDSYDCFTGDSFAGLDVALTVCGWDTRQKIDLYVDTSFSRLISPFPWSFRKYIGALNANLQMKLDGVRKFIDDLALDPSKCGDRLVVPVSDLTSDAVIYYCEKKPAWAMDMTGRDSIWVENAFSSKSLGFGRVLTRGMALPGLLADVPWAMDGGLWEHPPMGFMPLESNILQFDLGYPGLAHFGDTSTLITHSTLTGSTSYIDVEDRSFMRLGQTVVINSKKYVVRGLPSYDRYRVEIYPHANFKLGDCVYPVDETVPKTMLDRALYAYDVAAADRQKWMRRVYPRTERLHIAEYKIASLDLDINKDEKLAMIDRARRNVKVAVSGLSPFW